MLFQQDNKDDIFSKSCGSQLTLYIHVVDTAAPKLYCGFNCLLLHLQFALKVYCVTIVHVCVTSRYLAGGVESGFKKVNRDEYEPRLLHVKGRRNIRVQQTKLSWGSMNRGDVFILDLGLTIYVWIGAQAGRLEKIKAMDVARRIRDEERGGKAELIDFSKCG